MQIFRAVRVLIVTGELVIVVDVPAQNHARPFGVRHDGDKNTHGRPIVPHPSGGDHHPAPAYDSSAFTGVTLAGPVAAPRRRKRQRWLNLIVFAVLTWIVVLQCRALLVLVLIAFAAGFFLHWAISSPAPLTTAPTGAKVQMGTCSMHPDVREPFPGRCPICTMPLIPVEEGPQETGGPLRLVLSEQAKKLIFTRWCLTMTHFERMFYSDPEADLDMVWWDLVERYQLLQRPDGRKAPDWAAKIHVALAPVYYLFYRLVCYLWCRCTWPAYVVPRYWRLKLVEPVSLCSFIHLALLSAFR